MLHVYQVSLAYTLYSSFRNIRDKRSPQLMLLYAFFFRTCINPSLQ